MERLHYENKGTKTFLIYNIDENEEIDELSLKMLLNNKIPGFASAYYEQEDENKYIQYDVSAKISVKQYFSGTVSKKGLLGVFKGIIDACLSTEDYMLMPDSIVLDLDYIFVDVTTCETVLVCLPVDGQSNQCDMKEFFKGIMFNTKFSQDEDCDYVARLINYLNGTPMFTLENFKKILAECQSVTDSVQRETAATQAVKTKSISPPNIPQSSSVQSSVEMAKLVSQVGFSPVIKPTSNIPSSPKEEEIISVAVDSALIKESSQEKEISLFYLLQHYNKDNAAAYKAQKAAKKGSKADISLRESKKNVQTVTNQNMGFAIPGQESIPIKKNLQRENTVQSGAMPLESSKQLDNSAIASKPANFGNTTVLDAATKGATTVLDPSIVPGMGPISKPYLIRKKNDETIPIDKTEYRLGKERSFVDYFIGDNTAISRSHACIICHDNAYFVVDTNSTNHTFVNDVMIQSNVETKLESGTKIRLADEEFEFKMM